MTMEISVGDLRSRFRALHEREQLFVMPNPWDVGSAKVLASLGFEALATTSAGLAWSLGKLDGHVMRGELVHHVAALARATALPLNVDSEHCYPHDPGGISETVARLAEAGAAGFSIEDYDPGAGIVELADAVERVAVAAEAAHALDAPLVLTARAENYVHGIEDLDDTIARLVAYRDAGADVLYAPRMHDLAQIAALVEAVGIPVNVLAFRGAPTVPELESVGVRRVSSGGWLASAALGALYAGANELRDHGTSKYLAGAIPPDALKAALGE